MPRTSIVDLRAVFLGAVLEHRERDHPEGFNGRRHRLLLLRCQQARAAYIHTSVVDKPLYIIGVRQAVDDRFRFFCCCFRLER